MVIWITGLSGAGKTTVCTALHALLKPSLPEVVMLDGDSVRAAFGHDLGHEERDRVLQVRRLQGIAKVLSEQGLVVLVAVLYNNPELLTWNRTHLGNYFEVFIDAPLALVRARNPKQLYSKAARGEVRNVVGIDIPWHPPQHPDLVVDATLEEAPREMALRIAREVLALRERLTALRGPA